jgi:hypothetical protein
VKKIKKVNRRAKKQRLKVAQKALKQRAASMLNIPDHCAMCKTGFDKKNKQMTLTWHVTVYQEREKIYLTCPPCRERINIIAEEQLNAEV